ncbi:hypothetical protein BGZ89_001524 [Linnemannia elongata]|nr:hypothetical protein BGZ89_001524 [Linnemannia elongata]
MSIASDSRSWSVSTFSNAVSGVGGGRSLPETKEQSNWIHLSTPNHHLTLTLKLSFRPHTQADLDSCRPLLLIHTGNEVLESLGLDRASVRSSKLRGVVKGSMIGFRYTSSSSSSASASLAPAPGSSQSESHKFQIKFNTLADCGKCSSLLSSWIECQSVAPQGSPSTQLATTAITTSAASASTSPQTLSTAPTPVGTSAYVGSEELAHILRSAATNNIVLTQTAPATTNMSSPPLRQHQQQQQRNRQARLSLTPQSTPMAMAMPSSVDASCQQRNIEIHDGSVHNNVNVSNNDSISVSTSTTNDDDLSILLNLPNDKLQEDIDSILHDPLFQDLLLKVDILLRGPVSKR